MNVIEIEASSDRACLLFHTGDLIGLFGIGRFSPPFFCQATVNFFCLCSSFPNLLYCRSPLVFPSVKLTHTGDLDLRLSRQCLLSLTAGLMPRIRFAWLGLFCKSF